MELRSPRPPGSVHVHEPVVHLHIELLQHALPPQTHLRGLAAEAGVDEGEEDLNMALV